jgi:hypothetical protein
MGVFGKSAVSLAACGAALLGPGEALAETTPAREIAGQVPGGADPETVDTLGKLGVGFGGMPSPETPLLEGGECAKEGEVEDWVDPIAMRMIGKLMEKGWLGGPGWPDRDAIDGDSVIDNEAELIALDATQRALPQYNGPFCRTAPNTTTRDAIEEFMISNDMNPDALLVSGDDPSSNSPGGAANTGAETARVYCTNDGSFGSDTIRAVQLELNDKGYNLHVDGIMGSTGETCRGHAENAGITAGGFVTVTCAGLEQLYGDLPCGASTDGGGETTNGRNDHGSNGPPGVFSCTFADNVERPDRTAIQVTLNKDYGYSLPENGDFTIDPPEVADPSCDGFRTVTGRNTENVTYIECGDVIDFTGLPTTNCAFSDTTGRSTGLDEEIQVIDAPPHEEVCVSRGDLSDARVVVGNPALEYILPSWSMPVETMIAYAERLGRIFGGDQDCTWEGGGYTQIIHVR